MALLHKAQISSCLEFDSLTCGYLDFLLCAGIDACAGGLLGYAEGAETDEGHLVFL